MNLDEIKELLESNKLDKIKLEDIKTYNLLIEFLTDKNDFVRKNATKLLFSKEYIPVEKVLEKYIKSPHSLLAEIIVEKLDSFIPILFGYLIKKASFSVLYKLLSKIPANDIIDSITRSYQTTPIFTSLTELAIRTCHPSLANSEETFINYQLISEQSSNIKKILHYRFKQDNPIFSELTLLTVTKFSELASLIVKQIREICSKSKHEEQVRYAAMALMHLDEPKNADVLINRLTENDVSIDTQLAIIEALGNLGNKKATKILIKQFSKGDPTAYHSAKSLALIGESTIPDLINALKDDRNIPYIIETMKRIGDICYDYLMKALQKGKGNVRRNAAQCLTLVMSQKYGYEGAIRLLTSQLAGKNPSVLEAATQALLTLGTPSIKVLIEELVEDDLKLRKNAIEVLNYFGVQNIELSLDGLMDSEPITVVKLGLILYMYYPDEELQNLGYTFAITKNKLNSKDKSIFNLLIKSSKELDPDIRIKACKLLFYFGSKAVPPLSTLLADPNILVRRQTVESLRKIKSKRAMMTLIKAAKDSDDTIAEIATRALGELKDPGVIDVIISNMKRSKALVRDSAIYAATQIGPPIAKKLSKELESSNKNLNQAIITALAQMDSKILVQILPYLKNADDKWFRNIKQVVKLMGKKAIPSLNKLYTKAKKTEYEDRLLLLFSLTKDVSSVSYILEKLSKDSNKNAITSLNILGKDSVEKLVKELSKLSMKNRKLVVGRLKGLRTDIVVELINSTKESSKLGFLPPTIIKNHTRKIRRYCKKNNIKFNDFVKQYS